MTNKNFSAMKSPVFKSVLHFRAQTKRQPVPFLDRAVTHIHPGRVGGGGDRERERERERKTEKREKVREREKRG